MATSGTIRNDFRTGYAVQIYWTSDSQNVENNTTTVTARVQLVSTGASYTINSTATKSGSLTINGASYSFTFSAALSGNQTKTIFTKTVTIPHNLDGTKTCTFSATAGIAVTLGGTYWNSVTASGNGTFNTIPRASTPTLSASTAALGANITITTNRASTAFTHTLTYVLGAASGTIATGVTTSYAWTLPKSLANAMTNTTSGSGTITCKTYSGSTLIGTKSVSFTATIPNTGEFTPTISAVAISEATAGIAEKFGGFLQNKSKLAVSITAAGAYGSTITSYTTYIQAVPYRERTFTSNLITASGTIGVVTTVTDSRGRSVTANNSVSVIAYTSPTITTFSGYRAAQSGTEDYEGQYLNATMKFDIASGNNLNNKSYKLEYQATGAATWTTITSGNVYSYDSTYLSGAILSVDKSYNIRLTITDFFRSVSAEIQIPTAFTLMDFRGTGRGMAIGKVSEKDALEIALDVEITGELIQEDRKAATLQNGWVNYGATYESATYWRDSCGVVHLAGLIKSGTTTSETVLFNLPSGYRPRVSEKFFCVSINAICVIDVYATGNVAIKTGANAGWLSLSGVTFRANTT